MAHLSIVKEGADRVIPGSPAVWRRFLIHCENDDDNYNEWDVPVEVEFTGNKVTQAASSDPKFRRSTVLLQALWDHLVGQGYDCGVPL